MPALFVVKRNSRPARLYVNPVQVLDAIQAALSTDRKNPDPAKTWMLMVLAEHYEIPAGGDIVAVAQGVARATCEAARAVHQ